MRVSVKSAETNLSDLIEAAIAGEEVVIERGDEPVAQLIAIRQRSFKFGLLQDQLGKGPNFFEPMSATELADWEGAA